MEGTEQEQFSGVSRSKEPAGFGNQSKQRQRVQVSVLEVPLSFRW